MKVIKVSKYIKKGITIPTRFGDKNVTKIWYNGKQPVREIEFEDGSSYKFTLNHKLLVKYKDGSEGWVQVADLNENMEIVEISQEQ